MKSIQLSDAIYEELKDFVADPFDDTPEVVIGRLVDIARKAKQRWSPLDSCVTPQDQVAAGEEATEEAIVSL